MKINSSYLLATKVEKIPENPDSGMVKKDGLYYPEWATDYLLVSAQAVSNSGTNFELYGSTAGLTKYGVEVAAGHEDGGYCLIYHIGNWSYKFNSAGWSVGHMGVGTDRARVFTFPSLQKAKMALLTGQLGEAVWNSVYDYSLYLFAAWYDSKIPESAYTHPSVGIYNVLETDGGTVIGTMNLGKYYASSGWRVQLTYTGVWDILAARALT